MKKRIIFIITILLLSCACSNNGIKNINLKTLNKKIENKESFVLYLNDESDGKVLKNTLNRVSKNHNIESYSLNTIKLNDNDLNDLKKQFMFDETNIIIFIKNGNEETVLSRINDLYISEKDLEQELINQNYIKK